MTAYCGTCTNPVSSESPEGEPSDPCGHTTATISVEQAAEARGLTVGELTALTPTIRPARRNLPVSRAAAVRSTIRAIGT